MDLSPSNRKSSYTSDPDVQLMLAFQAGDVASFETLLKNYYTRILNFIYKIIRDRDRAEEITQEVFIKVYQYQKKYVPKAQFHTWLYTIAKNMSLNELRKKERQNLSYDGLKEKKENRVPMQFAGSPDFRPDEQAFKKEQKQIVREAIVTLPENQRMAINLLRYERFTYQEIADTLGISMQAVKSLISRAREGLRQRLMPYIKDSMSDK